jgi:hypothetical protein
MSPGRGIIEVKDSTNVLLANVTRFSNTSDTLIGGNDYYYVLERNGTATVGITAETVGGLYRRGVYAPFVASTPDTTKPTVSLTSPVAGAVVSGTSTVSVGADDNVGVTDVALYDADSLIARDATPPYAITWNTTGAPDGTHVLTAKASDVAGNSSVSSAVSVTVKNANLSLEGVNEGQVVSGRIDVEAVPTAAGISKIDFFVGATQVNSEQLAPYWLGGDDGTTALGFDTTRVADGLTTVRAVMTYTGGTKEAKRTVKVDNTKPTRPVLSAGAVTSNAVSLKWTASSDGAGGSGVVKYRVFRTNAGSTSMVGNSTTLGYTDSGVNARTSYSYYVVAVDAVGNVSANSNVVFVTTSKH